MCRRVGFRYSKEERCGPEFGRRFKVKVAIGDYVVNALYDIKSEVSFLHAVM